MRCAGKVYRLQTRASCSAEWEIDGGNCGPWVPGNRGPASCATAGNFDYASDRDGDCLQGGGTPGAGAVCPRAEDVPAHGWGADFKRRGGAATNSAPGDARSGSGCAFVWRHKERVDGSGGGCLLSSGTGGRFLVCAQAGDATGLEDALHVGADGGAADGRSLDRKGTR